MNTVLVVDDNATLAYFAARNLERDLPELEVLTASSYQEARGIAREKRLALVVADIRLGEGNGIRLVEEFRQACPHLRAILISGAECPDLPANGLVSFLRKPYEAAQLSALVRSALTGLEDESLDAMPRLPIPCTGYDRHHLQNKLAGILMGLRALEADVRSSAHDRVAVCEILNRYVDGLAAEIREVSLALPACPSRSVMQHL
jgi:two-component system, response regulator RegA